MIPLRDHNPSRRLPLVTGLLIAANALLFFYELTLGPELERFLFASAFIPARVFAGPEAGGGLGFGAVSALLSMFLHGGWMHFIGNMLFLWIFGDNVEDRLGHGRFLLFYLACGYAATLAHAASAPASAVPAIGASGAIAGVLGAYLVLYPRARIVTLFFLGFFIQTAEVPALVYLPLWFLIQFFSGLASLGAATAQQGGVAWFAHIGGFVAGPLLLWLLGGWRRRRPASRPTLLS
jgi:membrane associated rhomboid family serine protease